MQQRTKKKIQLLSRIPGFHKYYYLSGSNAPYPVNITISLLYSCNSRCMTCNVYEKRVDNFTVDDYRKTFEKMGHAPFWFTFSGGEPFLRKDIVDCVKAAYDHCRPGIINIPTNGSLNKVIPSRVQEMVEYCKDSGTNTGINEC